jgi:hypothetical protein
MISILIEAMLLLSPPPFPPKQWILLLLSAHVLYVLIRYRDKSMGTNKSTDPETIDHFQVQSGSESIPSRSEEWLARTRLRLVNYNEVSSSVKLNPFSELTQDANLNTVSESIYNIVKSDPDIKKLFGHFSQTEFIDIIRGTLSLFSSFCATTGKAPAIPAYIQFLIEGKFHILPFEPDSLKE